MEIISREERTALLLEDLEHKATERKKLEPTLVPKAKAFKKALAFSGLTACIGGILLLMTIVIHVAEKGEVVMSPPLIIYEATTVLGIIAYVAIGLSRYIWERRLKKVGLFIPLQYK